MNLNEFLKLEDVAKMFGVSKDVVSRWRRDSGMPVIKLDNRRYLVHEPTLAAWLKSREQVRPETG